MVLSANFKLSSNGGSSYGAVNASFSGATALAYVASGTYSIKALLDSGAGLAGCVWELWSADDINSAILPTVTTAADQQSCTFSVPKTGGSFLLRATVNGGVDAATGVASPNLVRSLKIAILNSAGNEEMALGETMEADSTFGYVGVYNALARNAGSGSVPLGGANQVYWSDGAANGWASSPILSAVQSTGSNPATTGFVRAVKNITIVAARDTANGANIHLLGTLSDVVVVGDIATGAGMVFGVTGAGSHAFYHGVKNTLLIERATQAVTLTIDNAATSLGFLQASTTANTGATWTFSSQESTHASGTGGDIVCVAGPGITRGGNIKLKCGTSAGTPGKYEVWINGSIKFTVQDDGHAKIEALDGPLIGTSGVVSGLGFGSTGQVLTTNGSVCSWGSAGGGAVIDDNSGGGSNNIRSDRALQSPIDNTKAGITNLANRSGGGSTGCTKDYSTAIGGDRPVCSGDWSTCVGGYGNTASGDYSFCAGLLNIASGARSVCMGGNGNESSGQKSIALGGDSNGATGTACFVGGGSSNTAGGNSQAAVVGGNSNTASGTSSGIIAGSSCTASQTNAFASGDTCQATAIASRAVGSLAGATRQTQDSYASGGHSSVVGSAQTFRLVLRGSTPGVGTNESTELLFGAGADQYFTSQASRAYTTEVSATAKKISGGSIAKTWKFLVLWQTDGSGVVTVTASADLVTAFGDAATALWTLAVTAGTTPDRIVFTFATGAGNTHQCKLTVRTQTEEVKD